MWPLPSALAVESRSGLAAVSGLACWSELGPMWPLPLVLAKALALELLPRPVAESLSFQELGWKSGALPVWAWAPRLLSAPRSGPVSWPAQPRLAGPLSGSRPLSAPARRWGTESGRPAEGTPLAPNRRSGTAGLPGPLMPVVSTRDAFVLPRLRPMRTGSAQNPYRGRPRPRVAMTLRWISDVPPPMVAAIAET